MLVVPATVPAGGLKFGKQRSAKSAAPTPATGEAAKAKQPRTPAAPVKLRASEPKRTKWRAEKPAKAVDNKPGKEPGNTPGGGSGGQQPDTDPPDTPEPPDNGGSTGPTGAPGPTDPEPGGVGEPPNPGTDPANPTPAPDSGAPAPPATPAPTPPDAVESPPAPTDEGTETDRDSRDSGRSGSDSSQPEVPGGGTAAAQVANTLAAVTIPEEKVRQRATEVAERMQVGAETLVVTRIVENVPDWVGFSMAGLGILALLSLGVFWRERRRRHSAEVDAMVDSLTGIPNRKAFDRRLDLEWRRAARYGRSLGLMVMDLDGFKAINDEKGHAAGDRVLREVAQKLDGRMRDTDLVARIGGDEFAVICPETGINELMTIRGQLADQATRGLNERVGLSIGVAEYVPSDQDPASILARADESMYRVKRGERSESVAHAVHA